MGTSSFEFRIDNILYKIKNYVKIFRNDKWIQSVHLPLKFIDANLLYFLRIVADRIIFYTRVLLQFLYIIYKLERYPLFTVLYISYIMCMMYTYFILQNKT